MNEVKSTLISLEAGGDIVWYDEQYLGARADLHLQLYALPATKR